MIIGIDITPVIYGTGVSVYTQNLVENLINQDSKNTYKLFFSSLRGQLPPVFTKLSQKPNVHLYRLPFPPSLFESIIWKLVPIEFFIGPLDLFHVWESIPARTKAKKIVTIHDLAPILYPETCHPKTIKRYQSLLKNLKNYSAIIAVSQNTKKDLIRLKYASANKISVILEAATQNFNFWSSLSASQKQKKINETRQHYNLKNPYFLTVGTREPRKNLSTLIKAYARLLKTNPQTQPDLVIVGRYGWGEDLNLGLLPEKVKLLGFVENEKLAPLYAGALAFIFPSLYEGFGLPPLEAMTFDCPVISSFTGPLPEVVGKAALLIDPHQTESLHTALIKIQDPALRKKLIQKGRRQIKKFSWKKAAQETLNLYSRSLP